MAKPDRTFYVTYPGAIPEGVAIFGETFYAARARFCASAPDVEPGDVRLDPPRRLEP